MRYAAHLVSALVSIAYWSIGTSVAQLGGANSGPIPPPMDVPNVTHRASPLNAPQRGIVTDQDVPATGEVPPVRPVPTPSLRDPRCDQLTDAQRRVTPGCN